MTAMNAGDHQETILVTGATGYIGGRLVPQLLAKGYLFFEAWLRISRMPPNRQLRNQVPIATQQRDDDRLSGATTLYEVHSCASALPRLRRITPAPCNTGRSD